MSLHARFRSLRDDEQGFALVLAVSLITLVTIVSLSMMTLTQGEETHSIRDQANDGAYQAAEAGTNAYLSDLTESNTFYLHYMAKGEATRTDSVNAVHPANNCTVYHMPAQLPCADLAWSSGNTWTYKTAPVSDTGWYNLGNGYDYLIQVTPPNANLTGTIAPLITTVDVIGRPHGGVDVSQWHTIETTLRPSSLTDFQAFLATSISYGSTATTQGPIFVGEDASGNPGNLAHAGTAQANLYAEGTVSGGTNLTNGAKKYDKNSTPTALCKLNNCAPVLFSSFNSTITTVQGAAASPGGISLAATDPTNAALSAQSPAYTVDAWKLVFQSNGTVLISSCKMYRTGSPAVISAVYDGSNPPVCGTAVSKAVPAVGAIYVAADAIVSGVVHGRVTVASTADIIYGGNTTYLASDGSDVLGVEASGEIYIAQWAPDIATGDILLYSAQLALHGPWEADPNCNNTSQCHQSSSTCNPVANCTMTFYGSSALYGQTSGAISMAGMFDTRNYNYDYNLVFAPPPWFPTLGNAYTILVQREL